MAIFDLFNGKFAGSEYKPVEIQIPQYQGVNSGQEEWEDENFYESSDPFALQELLATKPKAPVTLPSFPEIKDTASQSSTDTSSSSSGASSSSSSESIDDAELLGVDSPTASTAPKPAETYSNTNMAGWKFDTTGITPVSFKDRRGRVYSYDIRPKDKLMRAQYVKNYLMENLNLTKAQACAVVANIFAESKFNEKLYNRAEDAQGLAQWRAPRRNHKNFLKLSFEDQLAFLVKDLQTEGTWNKAGGLKKLRTMNSPSAAAQFIDQHFERSDGQSRSARAELAEQYYRVLHRRGGKLGLSYGNNIQR